MNQRCGIHLRGNATCPIAPLYGVRWRHHGRMLTRVVCPHHLIRAIEDALCETGKDTPTVEVMMWDPHA